MPHSFHILCSSINSIQKHPASRSIQHHLSSRIPQCSKKRTWIMDDICTGVFLLGIHEYFLSLLSAQQILSVTASSLQVLVVGEHLSFLCLWLMTWSYTTRTIFQHHSNQAQSPYQGHPSSAHHRAKHICSH